MRYIAILQLMLLCNLLFSQSMKERRVYYLDCTNSMEQLRLWNPVRDNLKKAIMQITDETTEIVVVTFTDAKHRSVVIEEKATKGGKDKVINTIDGLSCKAITCTDHLVPLQDFYSNRVSDQRVNYMFLMTDGQTNTRKEEFYASLKQWGNRYSDKNVFGFYVMLNNKAKNSTVEKIINSQQHLWKVETADINVNIIRFDTKAVFNVTNDEYTDIPVYGNTSNITFQASTDDADYSVSKIEKHNGALRLYIKANKPQTSLPQHKQIGVKITANTLPDFTYLVTEYVNVTCKNEKEYTLKVSVRP